MKKLSTLLIVIIALVAMQGCENEYRNDISKGTDNGYIDVTNVTDQINLMDYLPVENITFKYSGGLEGGGYTRTTEIIENGKAQLREISAAGSMIYVFRINNDERAQLLSHCLCNATHLQYPPVEGRTEYLNALFVYERVAGQQFSQFATDTVKGVDIQPIECGD